MFLGTSALVLLTKIQSCKNILHIQSCFFPKTGLLFITFLCIIVVSLVTSTIIGCKRRKHVKKLKSSKLVQLPREDKSRSNLFPNFQIFKTSKIFIGGKKGVPTSANIGNRVSVRPHYRTDKWNWGSISQKVGS